MIAALDTQVVLPRNDPRHSFRFSKSERQQLKDFAASRPNCECTISKSDVGEEVWNGRQSCNGFSVRCEAGRTFVVSDEDGDIADFSSVEDMLKALAVWMPHVPAAKDYGRDWPF